MRPLLLPVRLPELDVGLAPETGRRDLARGGQDVGVIIALIAGAIGRRGGSAAPRPARNRFDARVIDRHRCSRSLPAPLVTIPSLERADTHAGLQGRRRQPQPLAHGVVGPQAAQPVTAPFVPLRGTITLRLNLAQAADAPSSCANAGRPESLARDDASGVRCVCRCARQRGVRRADRSSRRAG
jgi:hypothetical protein